jgi:hypothetical protein
MFPSLFSMLTPAPETAPRLPAVSCSAFMHAYIIADSQMHAYKYLWRAVCRYLCFHVLILFVRTCTFKWFSPGSPGENEALACKYISCLYAHKEYISCLYAHKDWCVHTFHHHCGPLLAHQSEPLETNGDMIVQLQRMHVCARGYCVCNYSCEHMYVLARGRIYIYIYIISVRTNRHDVNLQA